MASEDSNVYNSDRYCCEKKKLDFEIPVATATNDLYLGCSSSHYSPCCRMDTVQQYSIHFVRLSTQLKLFHMQVANAQLLEIHMTSFKA